MRDRLGEIINSLSKKNKNIYLIAADISPSGKIIEFKKKNPKNFINVGVAEQSMIGIGAGLAIRGKIPFLYTIATFAVYRPFEMIRDDLCYQNLPVTLIGMGSGTIYSTLGSTHTANEDVGVLRALPNIKIFTPCDALELEQIVKYCAFKSKGPNYIRIGKTGEKNYSHLSKEKWKFNKIRLIDKNKNSKTCIITFGPIIKIAFEAKQKIKKLDIYSCSTLKPFNDKKNLLKIFKKYKKIVILEDHSEIGGLTEIIKGFAYEYNFKGKIISFSLKDEFIDCYGSQEDLLKKHDISVTQIVNTIR